jgi:hypothetical protein
MTSRFSLNRTPQPTPIVCRFRRWPPLYPWQVLSGTLCYLPGPTNPPYKTVSTSIYLSPNPEDPRSFEGTIRPSGPVSEWYCHVYFYSDARDTFSIGIGVSPFGTWTDNNPPPAAVTAGNGRTLNGDITDPFLGVVTYDLFGLPLSPEVP